MILNNQLVNKNLMLYKKPTTLLTSKNNYNEIIKRTMMYTPSRIVQKTTANFSNTNSRTFTRIAAKIQPKSKAALEHANDNTGKHTHVADYSCIEKDCDTRKCPTLCNTPSKFSLLGHHTHKPPIGRFCRTIDDQDALGKKRTQYFIKTNETSEIPEKDKQKYGTEIKQDHKQQPFVDQHHDKYD
jgi:hypothetical protein